MTGTYFGVPEGGKKKEEWDQKDIRKIITEIFSNLL